MVRTTEVPIWLDPTGKKTGLPEPRTAANVDMLQLLPDRLRKLYDGKECLRESDQEALNTTGKRFLVRGEQFERIIQMLYDTGIV